MKTVSGRCSYHFMSQEDFSEQPPQHCRNSFPVIIPEDPALVERWRTVFEWYGIPEGPSEAASGEISAGTANKDLVVVLGDEYAPAVRCYQAPLNRPLLQLKCASELERLLQEKTDLHSIFLITTSGALSAETLLFLNSLIEKHNPQVLLGCYTARNLASLTFGLAKLTLSRQAMPAQPDAFVDLISRMEAEVQRGNIAARHDISSGRLRSCLTEKAWRILVFAGHGEGSHLNLEDTVLCGLTSSVERAASGREINGCCETSCKRVHKSDIAIVHPYSLRAESIVFLTCNGFSTAAELYHSDVSLVLSAQEGYARSMIGPYSVLVLEKNDAKCCLEILRGVQPVGLAVRRLNRYFVERRGFSPIVLFGDPLENLSASVETPGEFPSSKPSPGILCGDISTEKAFSARREEHTVLLSYAREVFSKIQEARATLTLRFDIFAADSLLALTDRIATQASAMVATLARIAESGVWEQEILQAQLVNLNTQIDEWHEIFAAWFVGAQDDDLNYGFWSETHQRTKKIFRGSCPRCTSTLLCATLEPLLAGEIRENIECPICGTLADHPLEAGALTVEMPDQAQPGGILKLSVRFPPGRESPLAAFALLDVKDRSTGKVFYRERKKIIPAETDRWLFSVQVPPDIGSDIHSLRIMVIHCFDFFLARRRFETVRYRDEV